MSYLQRIYLSKNPLIRIFDHNALKSMHDAYGRANSNGKLPHEPDFVASLVKVGAPSVKIVLDRLFNGTGIRVATTGVFCHQSPMVKFKDGTNNLRCELGDVMFVHIHKNISGSVQRNALLLQAKMAAPSASKLAISTSERHQLFLYQNWPSFTYDMRGDVLNGKQRTIVPNCRHAGAQYLLIDSDPLFSSPKSLLSGAYPMAIWMAENTLYTNYSLGNALFDFLSMRSGREFSAKQGATGWSRVVWDLIENGLVKGFTRKQTNHVATPGSRMAGSPIPSYACFSMGLSSMNGSIVTEILGPTSQALSNADFRGSIPPSLPEEINSQYPNGGISLLLIETDESANHEKLEK